MSGILTAPKTRDTIGTYNSITKYSTSKQSSEKSVIQFELTNPLISAWIKFGQTKDIVVRLVDKIFAETPLTAEQYKVLIAIINHPGPVMQRDIGRWLYRKPNSISGLLSQMEKRGMVELKRSEEDRRVVYVSATDQGVALFWQVSPVVWGLVSRSLGGLTEQELQHFIELLDKFRATIGPILEDGNFVTETIAVDDQSQLDELQRRLDKVNGHDPAEKAAEIPASFEDTGGRP